jgi:ribosomal protein S18 acetylase RimI-like enzyme
MIPTTTRNGQFTLRHAVPQDAEQMEALQLICFPTLAREELMTREHFESHIRIFPEGQFVVTDQHKVIASSSTLRMQFPPLQHTLMEVTDDLWITHAHDPAGPWLYQMDIGVLPAYRGLKISTDLYNAQQALAKSLGMKGQVTVGMTIGYARYKHQYTIEEYCEKLRLHELTDPTVTPQRKAGFQWIGPIFNYVEDPEAGNCSVLMVWPLDSQCLPEHVKVLG